MISNLTVPVLNRYDLLQRMVSTIDYPVKHLLIIDNGGELDSLQVPASVKELTILPMLSNLGVATSWNLGLKQFYWCPVFYFASADMFYAPGDLEKLAHASTDEITLSGQAPHWQTFAIGEDVVRDVGLFDEALHPIYFEDNDYMRRANQAGYSIRMLDLAGGHNNSSTINSDAHYKSRNSATFQDNAKYYAKKTADNDFTEGRWDLERTRRNAWAK